MAAVITGGEEEVTQGVGEQVLSGADTWHCLTPAVWYRAGGLVPDQKSSSWYPSAWRSLGGGRESGAHY